MANVFLQREKGKRKKKKTKKFKKRTLGTVQRTEPLVALAVTLNRASRTVSGGHSTRLTASTHAGLAGLTRDVCSSMWLESSALHGTAHRDSSWYALASVLTWTHASFARKDICARLYACVPPVCACVHERADRALISARRPRRPPCSSSSSSSYSSERFGFLARALSAPITSSQADKPRPRNPASNSREINKTPRHIDDCATDV